MTRASRSSKQQAHHDANAQYCNEWLFELNTGISGDAQRPATDLERSPELDSAYEYAPDVWGSTRHDGSSAACVSSSRLSSLARQPSVPTTGVTGLAALRAGSPLGPLHRQRSLDVALDVVTANFLREAALHQLSVNNRHQHPHYPRRGTRRSLDMLLDEAEAPESDTTTWSDSNQDDACPPTHTAATAARSSARSSLDLLLDRAELPQMLVVTPSLPAVTLSSGHMTRSCSSRDIASEPRHQQMLGSRRGAYLSLDALMEHGEAS